MLGHVTPLLGLLGTVLGLIAVFHQMDLKGSQVQTSDLAVGIWQKLLNTPSAWSSPFPAWWPITGSMAASAW